MLSTMTSCSTLDEFIFEDRQLSDDQVLIVGGGISGLQLAFKLRQNKMDYKLFEGSSDFGGRIQSYEALDFGASLFNQSDQELAKLLKEFNLPVTSSGKNQFYFSGGAESLAQALTKRVGGLMPYRNIRLKWKLLEIQKYDGGFKLGFETPTGVKTMRARKVALTIPPSQWSRIKGLLELPEMSWAPEWLKTLVPESILKMHYILPAGVTVSTNKKSNSGISSENNQVNVLTKTLKNNVSAFEFEIKIKQKLNEKTLQIETVDTFNFEKMIELVSANVKFPLSAKKITPESFYNWSDKALIQSAYFKNLVPFPEAIKKESTSFQIFGDYSALVKPHSVEGALEEAQRVASVFV